MARLGHQSPSTSRFHTLRLFVIVTLLSLTKAAASERWTAVVVKGVTVLGPQRTPNVTNVSRDGGHSVLLNQRITWLYDDTQCMSEAGKMLSFVSNTATYSSHRGQTCTTVEDFGIVEVGKDTYGKRLSAILGDSVVGDGGWIPFSEQEISFNKEKMGQQRIAICESAGEALARSERPTDDDYSTDTRVNNIGPGTSPMPINSTHALLYAPLVYVDSKPENPAQKYVPRGTTLILMTSPQSGPQSSRLTELIFRDEEIQFGGFAGVVGGKSLASTEMRPPGDRDVYLFGVAEAGLQIARVPLSRIKNHDAYSFYAPRSSAFTKTSPDPMIMDPSDIYLCGTFTSGNVFFSPYYQTWLLVYFNKMVDSTFYLRYLDLTRPLDDKSTRWKKDGKDGRGISSVDVEALVRYAWSDQQTLYKSTPGPGGFNYAGAVHAEYFNRQYYPDSPLYEPPGGEAKRSREWYGDGELDEKDAGGDGKNLMLSWTYQQQGGLDTGIYKIIMARLQFDEIPPRSSSPPTSTDPSHPATPTTPSDPTHTKKPSAASRFRYAGLEAFLGFDRSRAVVVWAVRCELAVMAAMVVGIAAVF